MAGSEHDIFRLAAGPLTALAAAFVLLPPLPRGTPVKLSAAAMALVLLFGYGAPLERYLVSAHANSYIALSCMLAVAAGAVIGRYLNSRIDARLYRGPSNLGKLRRSAEQLRVQSTSVAVVPHLIEVIEAEQARSLRSENAAMGQALHVHSSGTY
ncbi:MAG: hypothetical protein ACHQDB_08660 [Steroidobacterales bacterium]